jgi:hypothetical protein
MSSFDHLRALGISTERRPFGVPSQPRDNQNVWIMLPEPPGEGKSGETADDVVGFRQRPLIDHPCLAHVLMATCSHASQTNHGPNSSHVTTKSKNTTPA